MSFFRFLFNLLWFVLGGVFMGLAWWLAGLLAFDRNGSGDRASFAAAKYRFGDTTLMGSYDDSRKAQNQRRRQRPAAPARPVAWIS